MNMHRPVTLRAAAAYLAIGAVLSIAVGATEAQTKAPTPAKKCANFNEYCLNHWDCCSNSCMSYLYRCSAGTGMRPTLVGAPAASVPMKATLEEIIAMNFGPVRGPASGIASGTASATVPHFGQRFGGVNTEDDDAAKKPPSTTSTTTTRLPITTDIVEADTEVTSVAEHQKEEPVTDAAETTISNAIDREMPDFTVEPDDLTTLTPIEVIVVPIRATAPPACKEIGKKCYVSEDCCTRRCHGYLHQCVT